MSKRINIMIDDDTLATLEKIPVGERSRIINDALRHWTKRQRRMDAAAKLDRLAPDAPEVTTEEIVRWIRADRDRDLS